METYHIVLGGISTGIPVQDLNDGYKTCYWFYTQGVPIKDIILIKMGDTYEDQHIISVEEYINKHKSLDSKKNLLNKDFE